MIKTNRAIIAISGNIGAGKTTVVNGLVKVSNNLLKPCFEPVDDNPYMEDFYKDTKKYSFPTQVWFLVSRYKLYKKVVATNDYVIIDRHLLEDWIFARTLWKRGDMTTRDYNNYLNLLKVLNPPSPDVVIYLDVPVKELVNRINKRDRSFEQKISQTYLADLEKEYLLWLRFIAKKYPQTKIVKVPWGEMELNGESIKRIYKKVVSCF
ncbi:MAG: deoxynucleoside kinase [Patescibacteria group bacterium]